MAQGTREWFLRVGKDAATALKAAAPEPALTMQLPFGAFLAVLRGETTLGRLMLEEDSPLHVEGKLGLLGRTQEILVPPGTF